MHLVVFPGHFAYLNLSRINFKSATDGIADVRQRIPGRSCCPYTAAGNQGCFLFRFFRTDLCGNGLRADELDSALLQRNGRVVKVLCRLAHILGKVLHCERIAKRHFRHLDRLELANRLRISPTPWTRPFPLKAPVVTLVAGPVEQATVWTIYKDGRPRREEATRLEHDKGVIRSSSLVGDRSDNVVPLRVHQSLHVRIGAIAAKPLASGYG